MNEAALLIKDARKAQGLTQARISELSGVGLNTISKIESGRSDVSMRNFISVIDAVGIRLFLRGPLSREEVPING